MRWLISTLFLVPILVWGIDVRTNVNEVSHEGCCEQIGSFSLTIKEGELPTASFDNPIYIRFRIIEANGWSKTLVDLRPNSTSLFTDPIDLAIRSEEGSTINPDIPRNALQLVRLIAGEKEGWIQVNASEGFWAEDLPGTDPAPFRRISISLGISGPNSIRLGSSTPTNGNEFHDSGELASTIFCANYENTSNFQVGDLDMLDFISFDSTSRGVTEENVVFPGANTGMTFSDDTQVARGAQYIACFDMVTDNEIPDSPPHELAFTRLSAINLAYGCEKLPPVYITNCGDFEWHAGSSFYFCSTTHYFNGTSCELVNPSSAPIFYMNQPSMNVVPFGDETWQIEPIFSDGTLAGYALTLLTGTFPPQGSLKLEDIFVCLDNDYNEAIFNVRFFAELINPAATEGELQRFGSFSSNLAFLSFHEIPLFHQIMPYTGYDHETWDFRLHSVNISNERSKITSFLRNRHGLLLRIEGMQEMMPFGTHELSIKETFGVEADKVLAWVDMYSDRPFLATGTLTDHENEVFDIITSREKGFDRLNAPHITSAEDWQTTAYILASGTDSPRFFFSPSEGSSEQISAIRFPGSTAVYSDADFMKGQPKISWFEIEAETSTANGQIFYYRDLGSGGQLTSVPMGLKASTTWVFDHLGKPQNGWWNGVVINNATEVSSHCSLQIMDENTESLQSISLEVGPRKRSPFLLNDVLPGFENMTGCSMLRIESDQPIISFLLTGMESKDQLSAVPGNLDSGKKMILPYMQINPESWTGLVISNASDKNEEFYFEVYSYSGQVRSSEWIDLPANSKIVFLPETYLKDLKDSSHLIVNATGNVRGFALIGNLRQTELASLPLTPIP